MKLKSIFYDISELQTELNLYLNQTEDYNLLFNNKKVVFGSIGYSFIEITKGSTWSISYWQKVLNNNSISQYRNITEVSLKYLGCDNSWHTYSGIQPDYIQGNTYYNNREDSGYAVTSNIIFVDSNGDNFDVTSMSSDRQYKVLDISVANLTTYEKTPELLAAVGSLSDNFYVLKTIDLIIQLGAV